MQSRPLTRLRTGALATTITTESLPMPRSLWESDKSPVTLPTSLMLHGTTPKLGLRLGTADALSKLASVTNGPVRSAGATIKMAKPDQMNGLPAIEVFSVPERIDSVGAFVAVR